MESLIEEQPSAPKEQKHVNEEEKSEQIIKSKVSAESADGDAIKLREIQNLYQEK